MTVPAAVVRSVVCFVHVYTRGALEYKTEKVHEVIPDLVEGIDANERIELDGERLRACHLFLLVDPEAVLDYTACYSVILSVPLLCLSVLSLRRQEHDEILVVLHDIPGAPSVRKTH